MKYIFLRRVLHFKTKVNSYLLKQKISLTSFLPRFRHGKVDERCTTGRIFDTDNPEDHSMAKKAAGPKNNVYANTATVSMRTALELDLVATSCIIPILIL